MLTFILWAGLILFAIGMVLLVLAICDFFSGGDKAGLGIVFLGIPALVPLALGGIFLAIAAIMRK